MIQIIGSRATGKTTEFIKIAKRKGYVLVVSNKPTRNMIQRQYDVDVVDAAEFAEIFRDPCEKRKADEIRARGILIDNLALCLKAMLGCTLKGYSMAIEPDDAEKYFEEIGAN